MLTQDTEHKVSHFANTYNQLKQELTWTAKDVIITTAALYAI
ncbi:hypothetical protein JNUCC1_02015 [Lentibacillus sp. JNUCC-1]|nr:hypothetical protein [Lentibacillus sp. JNUCC-1]MUV38184.1 hypothetical protein [Lentibacillus sp. JNUCC-1]